MYFKITDKITNCCYAYFLIEAAIDIQVLTNQKLVRNIVHTAQIIKIAFRHWKILVDRIDRTGYHKQRKL